MKDIDYMEAKMHKHRTAQNWFNSTDGHIEEIREADAFDAGWRAALEAMHAKVGVWLRSIEAAHAKASAGGEGEDVSIFTKLDAIVASMTPEQIAALPTHDPEARPKQDGDGEEATRYWAEPPRHQGIPGLVWFIGEYSGQWLYPDGSTRPSWVTLDYIMSEPSFIQCTTKAEARRVARFENKEKP